MTRDCTQVHTPHGIRHTKVHPPCTEHGKMQLHVACIQQHVCHTRNCTHQHGILQVAVHTTCTRIAPANIHVAQGVPGCSGLSTDQDPPVLKMLTTKGFLSSCRATATPVTSRDPQGGSAQCPGCPASSPDLVHAPRSRGCSAPRDPNLTSVQCSALPTISSWEWLCLTPSGGWQEGLGSGLPAPSLQGGLQSPPTPAPAAHSPGPPSHSRRPGRMLRAGPLC